MGENENDKLDLSYFAISFCVFPRKPFASRGWRANKIFTLIGTYTFVFVHLFMMRRCVPGRRLALHSQLVLRCRLANKGSLRLKAFAQIFGASRNCLLHFLTSCELWSRCKTWRRLMFTEQFVGSHCSLSGCANRRIRNPRSRRHDMQICFDFERLS